MLRIDVKSNSLKCFFHSFWATTSELAAEEPIGGFFRMKKVLMALGFRDNLGKADIYIGQFFHQITALLVEPVQTNFPAADPNFQWYQI